MRKLQLSELAQRIASSNPEDTAEQTAILESLAQVQQRFAVSGDHQTNEYLLGACTLMTFMSKMGHFGGTQVIEIASRLVESAHQSSTAEPDANAPAAAPETAPEAAPVLSATGGLLLQASGAPSDMRMVHDLLLGEIMVRKGMILPEHIDEATRVAKTSGLQFGEALLRNGAATWAQIEEALKYQDSCRQVVQGSESSPENAAPEPAGMLDLDLSEDADLELGLRLVSDALLGDVLVKNKVITSQQLDLALQNQKATGLRIGEALVNLAFCTWNDVEYGIQVQGQMRRYAS